MTALPSRRDPRSPVRLTHDQTSGYAGDQRRYVVYCDGTHVGTLWREDVESRGRVRSLWCGASTYPAPAVVASTSPLDAARRLVDIVARPSLGFYASGDYVRCDSGHARRPAFTSCPWCAGVERWS